MHRLEERGDALNDELCLEWDKELRRSLMVMIQ